MIHYTHTKTDSQNNKTVLNQNFFRILSNNNIDNIGTRVINMA